MKKIILATSLAFCSWLASAQVIIPTKNGDFNLRISGRTNLDAGAYVASSDDNLGTHNGIAVNDTRLGISASFAEHFSAKFEICYTDKTISFRDVTLEYAFNKKHALRAGNFFQPFGAKILGLGYKFVDDATVDNAFCPSRKLGLGYLYTTDPLNVTLGIFSDGNVDKKAVDQGLSAAAKIVGRPVVNEHTVFHLGAAAMYTQAPHNISFAGNVPTTIESRKIIKTSEFDPENILRLEAEVIYINRRFYAEGHWLATRLNVAGQDYFAEGGYAQAGFLLIGKQQNYNKRTGIAASASPKNLELLARVDYLHLDYEDYKFGNQTDVTIGLNYFFNKYLNAKLNYMYAAVQHGENYHLIQGRLQFSF